MHFQWKYVWLNVWHKISQQLCDISGWFQGNHIIVRPMVTWPMTSVLQTRYTKYGPIFRGQMPRGSSTQVLWVIFLVHSHSDSFPSLTWSSYFRQFSLPSSSIKHTSKRGVIYVTPRAFGYSNGTACWQCELNIRWHATETRLPRQSTLGTNCGERNQLFN